MSTHVEQIETEIEAEREALEYAKGGRGHDAFTERKGETPSRTQEEWNEIIRGHKDQIALLESQIESAIESDKLAAEKAERQAEVDSFIQSEALVGDVIELAKKIERTTKRLISLREEYLALDKELIETRDEKVMLLSGRSVVAQTTKTGGWVDRFIVSSLAKSKLNMEGIEASFFKTNGYSLECIGYSEADNFENRVKEAWAKIHHHEGACLADKLADESFRRELSEASL